MANTLFERCPLPWNYVESTFDTGEPEWRVFSSVNQYCVAVVNSEAEAKDLTNLVNITLTTKQKRIYGDSNTKMFVIRNKKTGMYRTNRYSRESGAIARARIWRSERQAKYKIYNQPDYEVIQVKLEAFNAHTG